MADKSVPVNIRLSQSAADGLKALADIRGITVSDYLRSLVAAELEKNAEVLLDYQRKLHELRNKMQ